MVIHPPMITLIENKVKDVVHSGKYPMVVVDAALIFEARVEDRFDYIVTVHAEPDTIIKRLHEQKKIPDMEIRRRIMSQIPQHEKIRKANYCIDNNGTMQEFEINGKKLFREMCDSYGKSMK